MSSWFNTETMLRDIGQQLNAQMLEAAEPIIKKALVEIEANMRKQLAASLISMLDTSYEVQRAGYVLRITVHDGKNT